MQSIGPDQSQVLEQLPEQIKTTWRITALMNGFWLLLPLVGAILAWQFWRWPIWVVIIAGCLFIVLPAIQLSIVPYRYHFTGYLISNEFVTLQSGFFFRKQVTIPITRIQNVTLEQGPVLRWQKLQAVRIDTAATSHHIEGVSVKKADALKTAIVRYALEEQDD
ncbi:PH domain-containing protein [Agrilactobacillus fermenti]|uniref:PH domain-containing protein n=1 Tax=Agrilactobacillus fermenti TaxID=2586909 RepID=UPI001E5D7943|nr:PH domain-containing protein [Agrilactobacillus fermenti]MCD2257060.1 PH domain-containing protein [Agrilactobacillus fermenti]